jgi:hypothetical protein
MARIWHEAAHHADGSKLTRPSRTHYSSWH